MPKWAFGGKQGRARRLGAEATLKVRTVGALQVAANLVLDGHVSGPQPLQELLLHDPNLSHRPGVLGAACGLSFGTGERRALGCRGRQGYRATSTGSVGHLALARCAHVAIRPVAAGAVPVPQLCRIGELPDRVMLGGRPAPEVEDDRAAAGRTWRGSSCTTVSSQPRRLSRDDDRVIVQRVLACSANDESL